jgi:predicted RNase H-like HicB family nuclease
MKQRWIEKGDEVIDLPNLTAVIDKEGAWYVATCPELGIASQGRTRTKAYDMLAEATELWLGSASVTEIRRRLRRGVRVKPLELSHA